MEHTNKWTLLALRAMAKSLYFTVTGPFDSTGTQKVAALDAVRALARLERAKRLALRKPLPERLWDFGY